MVNKNTIFCHVTSCTSIEVQRRFGVTYYLCLQGRRITQVRTGKKATSRASCTEFSCRKGIPPFFCMKCIVWRLQFLFCVCGGEIWKEKKWVRILGEIFRISFPVRGLGYQLVADEQINGYIRPWISTSFCFCGWFFLCFKACNTVKLILHAATVAGRVLFICNTWRDKREATASRPRCSRLLWQFCRLPEVTMYSDVGSVRTFKVSIPHSN